MNRVEAIVKNPMTPFLRDLVLSAFSPVLRNEIITKPGENGLFDFESKLLEGYGGIIMVKHFSLRDAVQTLRDFVKNSDVIIDREIVASLARHQANFIAGFLAKLIDLRVHSIVTKNSYDDAIARGRFDLYERQGLFPYLSDAVDTLGRGGIVPFAAQSQRINNLELYAPAGLHRTQDEREQNKVRTVGTLLAWAKRAEVENIAFLFVDLRVGGLAEGYWDRSWFNPLVKYEVRIGRVLILKQILEMASGNLAFVDRDAIWPEMVRTADIGK